jgi:APA family basic amino acid/polyamine antiporter
VFGLARDGLGPAALARVNRGGTPWVAMLLVGVVSAVLAASGTFARLLSIAVVLILVIDGVTVASLFWLRAREPAAPFRVPLYPLVPALVLIVYAALLVGAVLAQPEEVRIGARILVATWGLSWTVQAPSPEPSSVAVVPGRS